jgi:hypothetical protein
MASGFPPGTACGEAYKRCILHRRHHPDLGVV